MDSSATLGVAGDASSALTPANEATRGSAIRLGAEIAGRVLAFAATVFVARRLGASDFGRFAAASSLAAILAELGDLGLQAFAARALVARHYALADLVRARAVLLLVAALPVACLVGFRPLLGILMGYFLLANWVEFLGVALRARGAPLEEGFSLFTLRLAGLMGVVFAATRTADASAIALGLLASTLPALAVAALFLRHTRPEGLSQPPASIRSVIRTSLPLGANGALALLSTKVELLALPVLRSVAEAGLFAGALRLVEPLLAVPSAIAAGAMPALTKEALRGAGPARDRTAHGVALLAAPACVGLFVIAPEAIRLFGDSYVGAGPTLRLLSLAIIPLFLNALLLHSLIAAGRSSWLPRLTALRVLVAAGLAFVLLKLFGSEGAAIGFATAETVLLCAASRATRVAGFPVKVARPTALGLMLSAPMGLVVAFLPLSLFPRIGAGALVYGATLAIARLASKRFGARESI